MNESNEPKRKTVTRLVYGRLKMIEGPNGGLYTLELTKSGLKVRKWHSPKVVTIPLFQLTMANGVAVRVVPGKETVFKMVADGVEVADGKMKPKLLSWQMLSDFGRGQLLLFAEDKYR